MEKLGRIDSKLYKEIQSQVAYLLQCYREYAPERLGDVDDWSHDVIIKVVEKLSNPKKLTPFERTQIETIGVRAFIDRMVRGFVRETFRREDAGKDYVLVKDFLLINALILEKRFSATDDELQIKANLQRENLIRYDENDELYYEYENTVYCVDCEPRHASQRTIAAAWRAGGDDPLIYHIKEFRGDSDKGSKSVLVTLMCSASLFGFVQGEPRDILLNPGLRKTDRQRNVIATKASQWRLVGGLRDNKPRRRNAEGDWRPIKDTERCYTRKKHVVRTLFDALEEERFQNVFTIDDLHAEASPIRRTALNFDDFAYSIVDADAVGGEEESHFNLDLKAIVTDKLALDLLRNIGGGLSRRHIMSKHGWTLREYNQRKEEFLARLGESFADEALDFGDDIKRIAKAILEFMDMYSENASEESSRGEKQCKANH